MPYDDRRGKRFRFISVARAKKQPHPPWGKLALDFDELLEKYPVPFWVLRVFFKLHMTTDWHGRIRKTNKQLSERFNIKPANISNALKLLEKQGYIERLKDSHGKYIQIKPEVIAYRNIVDFEDIRRTDNRHKFTRVSSLVAPARS